MKYIEKVLEWSQTKGIIVHSLVGGTFFMLFCIFVICYVCFSGVIGYYVGCYTNEWIGMFVFFFVFICQQVACGYNGKVANCTIKPK